MRYICETVAPHCSTCCPPHWHSEKVMGRPVALSAADMRPYKKLVGYVPQEDIMLRELSVRDNVEYSARVRLPGGWSGAEVAAHVDATLAALSLGHVQHTVIGDERARGVSGGQRKRANIGMEVAACPVALCVGARLVSGLSPPPLHPSLASSCVPARRTGL